MCAVANLHRVPLVSFQSAPKVCLPLKLLTGNSAAIPPSLYVVPSYLLQHQLRFALDNISRAPAWASWLGISSKRFSLVQSYFGITSLQYSAIMLTYLICSSYIDINFFDDSTVDLDTPPYGRPTLTLLSHAISCLLQRSIILPTTVMMVPQHLLLSRAAALGAFLATP